MMQTWLKILPYFIVEYLAERYCEQISNKEERIYTAFNNSYILKYDKRTN